MRHPLSSGPRTWARTALFAAFLTAAMHRETQAQTPAEPPWESLDAILAEIIPPAFPQRDFPITDFGARAVT